MENQKPNEDKNVEIQKIEAYIGLLAAIAGPVSEYFQTKLTKHTAPITKSALFALIGMICLIIGASTALLCLDKIDKSDFTFIAGTILGYLFSTAKSFLKGQEQE